MVAMGGRNLRRENRRSAQQTAWIYHPDLGPQFSCQISDISHSGARLTLTGVVELPEEFMLLLTSTGQVCRKCYVVWRDRGSVGVRFIAGRAGEVSMRSSDAGRVERVDLDRLTP